MPVRFTPADFDSIAEQVTAQLATSNIGAFEEFHEVTLPTHKIVCPRCHGEGTHVNPAIDENGITSDEMAELGDDFREDYLAGVYDVRCETCGGRNVVDDVDEDACAPDVLAAWHAWQQSNYETEAMYRAERAMGA